MLDFDLDLRRLQPERGSTLHEHGAGRAVAAEFILLAFEREQRTFADIQELEIDEVSEKQAAFPGNREGVSGARGACAVRQSVTIDEGRLVLLPKLQVVRSFAEIDRADEIERVVAVSERDATLRKFVAFLGLDDQEMVEVRI
jgi:hypothetical protein